MAAQVRILRPVVVRLGGRAASRSRSQSRPSGYKEVMAYEPASFVQICLLGGDAALADALRLGCVLAEVSSA
jgi:hypothetical protein